MKSQHIQQAAKLLDEREELQALRSYLNATPSAKLAMYAPDGKGTMLHDTSVSNDLGRVLLGGALSAYDEALAKLSVDEFFSARKGGV